ncbi:Adenosine 3'-phospho 5'-phosphosulfate transporter 2 [Hondaea fermentalgiana]|uniref:Adenosine 3'-phospho 5'-phosphosulfate transporter 2 n=1 Tax=Hondaea fermentalgiana TaxID=2315210 RepID=A0A2R5GV02_9STRA|nr:Adenosine 3'-phospho 5'-phosphosulfate transporter 2 [Hondaea fermentalgiana]|eukprot:GBG32221.1 Adenosine 3'-phospho 5'-phosphosulfate transporter 2 [Hondaea fermentalgiana]
MEKKDDSAGPAKVAVFGVDLSFMSSQAQLLTLAFGNLSCSIMFALLQEKVFMIEGAQHGFVSLLTTLTFALCGFIECVATGDTKRRASLQDYAKLSVFTFGGILFTNWSLTYLNYPVRVLFKSSKVIPVMIVGVFLQGKRFTRAEYLSAFVLVTGISLFVLGDSQASPKFDLIGIVLITLGVLCDAITSNYEERYFFKQLQCSQAEVMMYASLFGSVWAVAPLVQSGDLFTAIAHAAKNPSVVTYTAMFSVLGYTSSIFVLVLIKHFGAVNAEIVKSCRKVFTIIFSFMLVSKPITSMHVLGGFIFTLSIVISVYVKKNKQKGKNKPSLNSSVA